MTRIAWTDEEFWTKLLEVVDFWEQDFATHEDEHAEAAELRERIRMLKVTTDWMSLEL